MMKAEALAYFASFPTFAGEAFGLDALKDLLHRLHDPQDELKCIHVAGTNGKGSTCEFLHQILTAAGIKTGCFTSPALDSVMDQIRIGAHHIDDHSFAELTAHLQTVIETMPVKPSQFETLTALAFEYFKQEHCELVILETGLGGTDDATNVIKRSVLDIMTPIDHDHMGLLGNTLTEIAGHKAGIIKPGDKVLTVDQKPEAMTVIQKTCDQQQAKLRAARSPIRKQADINGQTFVLAGQKYSIGLAGLYQINNAALAVQAAQWLGISDAAIRQGLAQTQWPARFEIIAHDPVTILDGGHNVQGAAVLKESLDRYFPDQKIVFVTGMLADKEYEKMLKIVSPLADRFYTVTPENPRALSAEALADWLNNNHQSAQACANVKTALHLARAQGRPVCVFGSLYAVPAIRRCMQSENPSKID